MRRTEYVEDRRVGAHIKAHREALGVKISELIAAAGPGAEPKLRFTEVAERPSLELINQHHAALMAAWPGASGMRPTPFARREQWYTTEIDAIMWHRAMETRPQIAWWWGVRSDAAPRGAYCYLCESMIHGYDVGRGLTARARAGVMLHRLTHVHELSSAPAESKGGNTK